MNKKAALGKFLCFFLVIFFAFTGDSFGGKIEDIYNDLSTLEKTKNISRRSYTLTADKFYKIYSENPGGKQADKALLGAARAYRRSYERFKIQEDLDKSLRYYSTLQSSFSSSAARDAYLESADVYESKRDTASAKYALNKLVSKYPDSDQAKKAKTKLAALEKKTGNKGLKPAPDKNTQVASNIKPTVPVAVTPPVVVAPPAPVVSSPVSNKEVTVPKQSSLSGDVTVHGIRYFSDKDYTRVVIDLSDGAEYKSHWLKEDPSIQKPPRLMIDINGSVIADDIAREITIKDGLLSSVRLGYHAGEKRTRVVLDSENIKDYSVLPLSSPSRIVIDVFRTPRGQMLASASSTSKGGVVPSVGSPVKELPPANSIELPSNMTMSSVFGLKIKTIVIDAGHGGKDPGAVANKLKEKDIVLDIAKQLRDYLKQDPSLTVYLTRDKDVFLSLEERTAIANKRKADIFISIHTNSARNTAASGLETFVFNVTSDKSALEVAALENQASTKSMSDLQDILKDLLRYSKLEDSLSLAGGVQKSMIKSSGAAKSEDRGVKQAPFYVLMGATMPAILVEAGFISNKKEAEKLKKPEYRKKLAKGIYDGVREYIKLHNGQ